MQYEGSWAYAGRGAERMRVAHLLLRAEIDGIGLHVMDLAAAQLAEGAVEPVVVTCPSADYAAGLAAAGVPAVRESHFRFVPALVRHLRSDFGRQGFDLVHLHGYRATHLFPALRLLRPAAWELPVVGTCHLLAEGSLRRAVRSALELRCYRHLDLLITSSAGQARRARSAAPAIPVRYVPNGVRLPAQRPAAEAAAELRRRFGFPAEADVVASIGRLHVQKRPDLFLRACRLISGERPGARFLLVGDGPERRRLERLAGELELEPFVRFAGFVDDVSRICRGLTLLMHAADNEGTPRAVLHAMAAGCPVVATASGGVADLVGDGVEGLIVPKGDVEGLARSSLWMLANPVERLEMGGRGMKRVESDFSIEAMRRQVEDGYRYAVGSSRGRERR